MAEKILSERAKHCLSLPFESEEQLTCYHEGARDILAKFTFAAITKAAGTFQAEANVGPGACHDILHHISAHYYKEAGDFPRVFEQCTPTCTHACYHGVVMAHVASTVEGSDLVEHLHLGYAPGAQVGLSRKVILEICNPFVGKTQPYDLFAVCANGVGHALPSFFGKDGTEEALLWCEVFDDGFVRYRCQEGVFHKLAFSSAWFSASPEQAFSLCVSVSEKHQKTCYGTMVVILGNRFRHDPVGFVRVCEAMSLSYVRYCYRMVGISAPLDPYDPEAFVARCRTAAKEESFGQCIAGVVRAFANKYIPYDVGRVVSAAQDVCERAGASHAESCYSELGRNIWEYSVDREQQKNLCAKLSSAPGQEFCMQPSAL